MAGAPVPALLKSTSRRPKVSRVLANSARTESGSVTSVGTGSILPPGEAAEGFPSLGEQRADGIRIGDVGGDREHPAARRGGRGGGPREGFGAPAGQHYRISGGL